MTKLLWSTYTNSLRLIICSWFKWFKWQVSDWLRLIINCPWFKWFKWQVPDSNIMPSSTGKKKLSRRFPCQAKASVSLVSSAYLLHTKSATVSAQCTVQPFVVQWRQEGKQHHQSFCIISQCTKHTTVTVNVFLCRLVPAIINRVRELKTEHYFSDGCTV